MISFCLDTETRVDVCNVYKVKFQYLRQPKVANTFAIDSYSADPVGDQRDSVCLLVSFFLETLVILNAFHKQFRRFYQSMT